MSNIIFTKSQVIDRARSKFDNFTKDLSQKEKERANELIDEMCEDAFRLCKHYDNQEEMFINYLSANADSEADYVAGSLLLFAAKELCQEKIDSLKKALGEEEK